MEEILHLQSVDSTNSYLRRNAAELPSGTALYADFQTSGRGQRGNGWESDSGENLLFSMLYRPSVPIPAKHQFLLSQAVSLAVRDLTCDLLTNPCDLLSHPSDLLSHPCDILSHPSDLFTLTSDLVTIKWPNDIYIGDMKVAGILIENTIGSFPSASTPSDKSDRPDIQKSFNQINPSVTQTIIGIGLNLNQRTFHSGAPNPVSVSTYTGLTYDLRSAALRLHSLLLSRLTTLESSLSISTSDLVPPNSDLVTLTSDLSLEYHRHLWRAEGFHPYRLLSPSLAPAPTAIHADSPILADNTIPANTPIPSADAAPTAGGTTEDVIMAEIVSVDPSGPITMRLRDGSLRTFAFKEITPILPS